MVEMQELLDSLPSKVESLTNKVNEVVACLNENEIYRKVPVEFIEEEQKQEEPVETAEELLEEGEEIIEE